jgi:polysaccharide biosynthesis/export protein
MTTREPPGNATGSKPHRASWHFLVPCAALAIGLFGVLTGCQTSEPPLQADNVQSEPQTIQDGDVLKISFLGSPTLDTQQTVRRDGRITLSIVGEVVVAGMTPVELEKDLLRRYDTQLLEKEVTVIVLSSSYSVFVIGAVSKPGKVQLDHPVTALEAVMEAGGFDIQRAKMKAAVVIRKEGTATKRFTLDLQRILDGKSTEQFYLRPFDILYIPEKYTWF